LQGIIATHYGNNGPLWSVAYEFWYYMLFPLLLLPLARGYSPRTSRLAAAAAAAASSGVTLAQQWFLVGFILWGLGAAAAAPNRPLMRSAGLALLVNIVTVISLRLAINGSAPLDYPLLQYASDLVSALAFANLILTLRFSTGVTWRPLVPRIHKQLADFSFTVYAIHNPSLLFIRAAATWLFGDAWLHHPATPGQWWALAVSMTIVLIVAFVLSRFTEAKTGAARRKLRQFVSRLERQPTAARVTPAQRSTLGADTREPRLNA
jgi:peptidoglycan/LPS O-acetylase OafA/YrhL